MAAADGTSGMDPAHELIRCLAGLSTPELARFTLQRPEVARVFAASLNALAVHTASSLVPPANVHSHAQSYVEILARLIERGDPSLARTFVPTHGALVDLAIVTPSTATPVLVAVLERLLDTSNAQQILTGLHAQLESVAGSSPEDGSAVVVTRTLARLAYAFLNACPARLLKDSADTLAAFARTCFQLYDQTLPHAASLAGGAGARGSAGEVFGMDAAQVDTGSWQAQWLTCRVDVLQLLVLVLASLESYIALTGELKQALAVTQQLLVRGGSSALINSTALLDVAATADAWLAVRAQILAALANDRSCGETLSSIEALTSSVPRFGGAAWSVLQRLTSGPRAPSSVATATAAAAGVSDEVVAAVDSVLPHYGVARLRTILAQPSFVGQNAEMVIQRLLEGDEGAAVSASPSVEAGASTSHLAPAMEARASEVGRSLVKSRANVFGAFDFDASTIAASKTARTARVDELTPSLKAAILARAEAESSDEDEEWNPFAAPARTVGVEDELDLDEDGRETRAASDDEDDAEAKMRERMLLRHYVEQGASSFGSDAAARRSAERQKLRDATGWSDDLLESWAVMLDRNPRKDRLLAAASQAQLDDHLASVNAAREEKLFGPDKGRGGRMPKPNPQPGKTGQGVPKQAPSQRAAKHKEKQGNKARRQGHDKKMARVNT